MILSFSYPYPVSKKKDEPNPPSAQNQAIPVVKPVGGRVYSQASQDARVMNAFGKSFNQFEGF